MSKAKQAIGAVVTLYKTKHRRRAKPLHLRGLKKLGPKSGDRGNRGSF